MLADYRLLISTLLTGDFPAHRMFPVSFIFIWAMQIILNH
jgi:hypothetical protein